MPAAAEVVITGVGIVSPIGIGREDFEAALRTARSGVGLIESFDSSALPIRTVAEIKDFVPKKYVANRKSLKVMCRDAKLGVAAARLAREDAGIAGGALDPIRLGVVLGADDICSDLDDSESTYRVCLSDGEFDFGRWITHGMPASFPLSFLKVLPNMIASHISIAEDAQGPNNTIHHVELSGLEAVGEAARVILRGSADVMLAGGASSSLNPFDCASRCVTGILSPRQDDPTAAIRPFDADRNGQVWGEGAAVFVLEDRGHAEARKAKILGRILGWADTCEATIRRGGPQGTALRRAIRLALDRAGLRAEDLGHVNAHGVSTVVDDEIEARALCDVVPAVPVTAPKSYFGNLGAAGGAMEMAVSLLALGTGCVPPTLNYETPDPKCPIEVIRGEPLRGQTAPALLVNWAPAGQASALVIAGPD